MDTLNDEANAETLAWFDSLPIISEAEIEELARLDNCKHGSPHEL